MKPGNYFLQDICLMEYMVKDLEGNVYGPVTQSDLEEWAKDERLRPDSEIRNVMFKHWRTAEEYAFLAPLLKPWDDKDVMNRPDPVKVHTNNTAARSLTNSFIFRFTPAGLYQRVTGYIVDVTIITLIWVTLSCVSVSLLSQEVVFSSLFTSLNIALFVFIYLLYFTMLIGLRAQTLGHWFWGIMVVSSNDGSPVMLGRAFTYSLLLLLTWWAAPYGAYITPAKRTLHGYLANCRVICTRRKVNTSK